MNLIWPQLKYWSLTWFNNAFGRMLIDDLAFHQQEREIPMNVKGTFVRTVIICFLLPLFLSSKSSEHPMAGSWVCDVDKSLSRLRETDEAELCRHRHDFNAFVFHVFERNDGSHYVIRDRRGVFYYEGDVELIKKGMDRFRFQPTKVSQYNEPVNDYEFQILGSTEILLDSWGGIELVLTKLTSEELQKRPNLAGKWEINVEICKTNGRDLVGVLREEWERQLAGSKNAHMLIEGASCKVSGVSASEQEANFNIEYLGQCVNSRTHWYILEGTESETKLFLIFDVKKQLISLESMFFPLGFSRVE